MRDQNAAMLGMGEIAWWEIRTWHGLIGRCAHAVAHIHGLVVSMGQDDWEHKPHEGGR